MRNVYLAISIFLVALAGCTSEESTAPAPLSAVGSDRDEHGCIGSAGYSWCPRTEECERPWELAERAGFANTPNEFTEHCGVTRYEK